jgi:hypothetical protein
MATRVKRKKVASSGVSRSSFLDRQLKVLLRTGSVILRDCLYLPSCKYALHYGREREQSRAAAVGLVNGLEITVVYTDENDEERRIISAWRAEPHERRSYWRNIES